MPPVPNRVERFFADRCEEEFSGEVESRLWGTAPREKPTVVLNPPERWMENLADAAKRLSATMASRQQALLRKEGVFQELRALSEAVRRLERCSGFLVPISTLAPEPYDLLQEIKAVVQPSDDEFIATFFDANVSAAGPNETAAVANLKDVLIATFQRLDELPAKRLALVKNRQLAVLREFIKKRA